MRAWDDHLAAGEANTILQAQRRAVAECRGRCTPQTPADERTVPNYDEVYAVNDWDHLCVDYLLEPWPASMLN
jgi:hypothetical protein